MESTNGSSKIDASISGNVKNSSSQLITLIASVLVEEDLRRIQKEDGEEKSSYE